MKNPALKKRRNWRNILVYLATYLVVTFSVAFVVVSFSNKTYSISNKLINPGETTPSALGSMVTNLMEMEDAKLSLNTSVQSDDTSLNIDGTIDLKIYPEFSGLEADINVVVDLNGTPNDVRLTYIDGVAYISVNDMNVSVKSSTIMTAVMGVLNMCGVELDLSADLMSSFDMSMLDEMGDIITEEKQGENTLLVVTPTDDIKLNVLLDKDYNICDIYLDQLSFSGTQIDLSMGFDETNSGAVITKPARDFVDVSESMGIFESVVKTFSSGKFTFGFDVFDHEIMVQADLKNKMFALSTNALETDFELIYANENIYFDGSIVKLKTTLPKFDLSVFGGLAEMELTSQQIDELKEIGGNILNAIKSIKLKAIEKTDFGYQICVNGVKLQFVVVDEKISEFRYVGEKEIIVRINDDANIEVIDEEYTNIVDFELFVDPIKKIVQEKRARFDLEFAYSDLKLNGTLGLEFGANKFVQFSTNIMDVDVVVTVDEAGVKLRVGDIKVRTDFSSIENLIDKLTENKTKNEIKLSDILKQTISFVKSENNMQIKYNDLQIDVVAKEKLEQVNVVIDKLNFELKQNDNIVVETNFDDYEFVELTKEKIDEICDIANRKAFGVSGQISYNDFEIGFDAKVDLSDGVENLTANIALCVLEQEINITIESGRVYVKYDTVKLYGDITDLVGLLGGVLGKTTSVDLNGFEIQKLLLEDDEIILTFAINDEIVALKVDLEELDVSLEVAGLKAELNLDFDATVTLLTDDEKAEYKADMSELVGLMQSVINSVKAENIKALITINLGEKTYTANLYYANGEKVKFETEIEGINVSGYFADGKVYLNIFDICFAVDLSDGSEIDQLIEVLNLESNTAIDVKAVLGAIKLDKLTRFETIKNTLKLCFDGVDVRLHRFEDVVSRVQIESGDMNVNVALTYPTLMDFELDNNRVIELSDLAYVGRAFYNTFKNKTISGDVDLSFIAFKEENTLNIRYGIKFGETLSSITGYIETEFKGLQIKAYFINETVYLDALGLKIKLAISDVPNLLGWIKEQFAPNLNIDDLFKDFDIADLSLDFITSVEFRNGLLKAVLSDKIYIDAEYTNIFERITFNVGTTKAVVRCTSFDNFTINSLNGSDYKDYSMVTDMIDAIIATASDKQFNIVAGSKVYRAGKEYLDINITLTLDFKDGFKLSGTAIVSGNTNVNLRVDYRDNMLYADYYGLKLKIGKKSIAEILAIVTQLLNIDISSFPGLEELQKELNLDMDNLGAIVPTMQNINPLNYINYLKNLDIDSNSISIALNGEKLNGNANFDPIVKLVATNGKISSAEITELYTGVTADEEMTMTVKLIDYVGMPELVDDGAYVDLTNSIDLIKALINTSTLTDYHIAGDVVMSVKLGKLEIEAAVVGVDVKVKLDSETKAPTIAIKLTNYPLVVAVTNKNTNGVGGTGLIINQRHRTINIYYKSGELFVQTIDEEWGTYSELNRVTKVTPSYMFNNLSYYVQWLLGFTDTIQKEIDDAIATSNANKAEAKKSGAIDYSDIIKNYVVENGVHSCDINIGKLAYNSDIGTLHVDISTTSVAGKDGSAKEYIGLLNFNLDLLDGLIIIKANKGTDYYLELKDIGSTVDVTNVDVAFEDDRFLLDGEYEKEGTGKWSIASQGDTTITLYNGNTLYYSTTGGIGTALTLPTPDYPEGMTSRVYFDSATLIETIYSFDGWFDAEGNKFTGVSYPRYSKTLYARWSSTTRKQHIITFVTNENVSKESIYRFAGESINLGTLANITFTEGYTTYLKSFDGWYFDEALTEKCAIDTMVDRDITLYAKWKITELSTINIYSLTIFSSAYSGEEALYENDKVIEGEFDLTVTYGNYINSDTLFYTTSSFEAGTEVAVVNGKIDVSSDMTLYAKSKFNYTTYSAYTTAGGSSASKSGSQYMGESLTLPVYADYKIAYSTYNKKYHFVGYVAKDINSDNSTDGYVASDLITAINGEIVTAMPLKSTKFVAVWEVKDYVTVTFNPLGWANPKWWTIENNISYKSHTDVVSNSADYVVNNNTIEIEKGTKLDTTLFKATTIYGYKAFGVDKKYDFETVAWSETAINLYDNALSSQKYDGETILSISSHITLQPVWKHV